MVADLPDGQAFDAAEGVDFAVGGRPEPDDPRSGPRQPPKSDPPPLPETLPVLVPASGPFGIATGGQEEPTASVRRLAAAARAYATAKDSANTARAYAADWKLFCRWCRRQGFGAEAPEPQVVGLYLAALAAGDGERPNGRAIGMCPRSRRRVPGQWGQREPGRQSKETRHPGDAVRSG